MTLPLNYFTLILFNMEPIAYHKHNGTDGTPKISIPDLDFTQQPSISNPSGGLTVDSQARSAINSLISTLRTLGFIQ